VTPYPSVVKTISRRHFTRLKRVARRQYDLVIKLLKLPDYWPEEWYMWGVLQVDPDLSHRCCIRAARLSLIAKTPEKNVSKAGRGDWVHGGTGLESSFHEGLAPLLDVEAIETT
jgi:hypothetical protein